MTYAFEVEYEYEIIDWYSDKTSKIDYIIINAKSKKDIPIIFNRIAKLSWRASLKHCIRIISIRQV